MTRSEITKKAWRVRKRAGGKATCAFCKKSIYSGGVVFKTQSGDYPFHKGCLEAWKFGLTRKQAGVANPRRTRDSYKFYGARELNPTKQYHMRELMTLRRMFENEPTKYWKGRLSQEVSNIMSYTNLSPEDYSALERARLSLKVTENPRPPARWWASMWSRTAAGYPRKASESLKKYRADISRIVGGIWYKLPEATRARLIRRYDKMAVPAKALTNPLTCPSCGSPQTNPAKQFKCNVCGAYLKRAKVS